MKRYARYIIALSLIFLFAATADARMRTWGGKDSWDKASEGSGATIYNPDGSGNTVWSVDGAGNVMQEGNIVLPAGGSAGNPLIRFGATNTGFFENGGRISVALNGGTYWNFYPGGDGIFPGANDYPNIRYELPTATNPGYAFRADDDTGLGRASANMLSGIAGGTEVWRSMTTGFMVPTDSGVSFYLDSDTSTALFSSGGEIYVSNSVGTDTKLTTHDLEGRAVHLSYNRYLDEVRLLEIERFMVDQAVGADKGPYVHTDWATITAKTGVDNPGHRDFWAEQEAKQKAAFVEAYIENNPVEVPEANAFETVEVQEQVGSMEEPETTYAVKSGKVVLHQSTKELPVYETKQETRLKSDHTLDPATGKIYRNPTVAEAVEAFTFDPTKVVIPVRLEGKIEEYSK